MNDLIEIRWHGRGGQGAKTASLLLADAAFNTGKYIQGFPEYGPERMGAPITAYNRISDDPITIHSNIYEQKQKIQIIYNTNNFTEFFIDNFDRKFSFGFANQCTKQRIRVILGCIIYSNHLYMCNRFSYTADCFNLEYFWPNSYSYSNSNRRTRHHRRNDGMYAGDAPTDRPAR